MLLSPACASFDQYRNFEVRGDAFRELVRALPGVDRSSEHRHSAYAAFRAIRLESFSFVIGTARLGTRNSGRVNILETMARQD